MTNTNYPKNIRCPDCGNEGRFLIAVTVWASLTDDAAAIADDQGRFGWNDDVKTRCPGCAREGRLAEFDLEDEELTSGTKKSSSNEVKSCIVRQSMPDTFELFTNGETSPTVSVIYLRGSRGWEEEATRTAHRFAASALLLEAAEQVLDASEDGGNMSDIDFALLRRAVAAAELPSSTQKLCNTMVHSSNRDNHATSQHRILLTVEGGVIQHIENIPPDTVVEVRDFDKDGDRTHPTWSEEHQAFVGIWGETGEVQP